MPNTTLGPTQWALMPCQASVGPGQAEAAGVVEAVVEAEGEDGVEEVGECPMAMTQVYLIDATRQTTMEEILPTNPPLQPTLEHLVIVMFSITTMTT